MKLAVLMWYVIVLVAFLKSVLPASFTTSDNEENEDEGTYKDETDEITHTFGNNSSSTPEPECDPQYFGKSDTFLISNQTCDNFLLNLEFNETSIIKITMFIQINENLTEYENKTTNRNMKVDIYERTVYKNNSGMNVLQEEWTENSTEVRIYLSLSSRVYINISRSGNWSDSSIKFTFDEIEYRLFDKSTDTDLLSGEETVLYKPNSVTLYSLKEMINKKLDGIEIKIENLNINKTMGEYLLIGPGTEIFKNEHFKPLYITELTEYSKFYVGCDTAYIAFVSGSTQNGKFNISWNRIEAQAPDTKENYLDNLKSSPICFWRNSTENRTLPLNIQEGFISFRKDFAAFINKKYNNNRLNETSIVLFGYPTEETINSSETLEIIIKVIDRDGRSIFKWSELQVIIGEFESNNTKLYHGYLVRKCYVKELPHKDDFSIAIYALAPMFALLALLIWAWKQNIFANRCRSEKKDELPSIFPSLISAEPNTFENTTQENYETFEDGELLNKFRSRKPRPSIQSLRDQPEASEIELSGNSGSNKTEHYYLGNGTINTGETKL